MPTFGVFAQQSITSAVGLFDPLWGRNAAAAQSRGRSEATPWLFYGTHLYVFHSPISCRVEHGWRICLPLIAWTISRSISPTLP